MVANAEALPITIEECYLRLADISDATEKFSFSLEF